MPLSIYTPLDRVKHEIRLLSLLPDPVRCDGSPLNPYGNIRCEVHTVSLDTNPKYEALSYVWGPPLDDGYSITINGIRVGVRHNLLLALNALQTRASTSHDLRTFWIDALCINQNDLSERGHQVQMMGKIYESSNQVVAWLGSPGDIVLPDAGPGYSLLKSDYWTRLWIIQELCLAPGVQLLHGSDSYGWVEFQNMIQKVPKSDRAVNENLIKVQSFHALLRLNPGHDVRERTLFGLLNFSRGSLCQDPRDKLYGILGLAYDIKDVDVPVSYTMSLFDLFSSLVERINFDKGQKSRGLFGRFGDLDDPNLFSWNFVEFCQILQLSLLNPNFGEEVHQEMQANRRAWSQDSGTGLTDIRIDTRFCLEGRQRGEILRVARTYAELLSPLTSGETSTTQVDEPTQWQMALNEIWQLDHRSFVKFTYDDSGASIMQEDEKATESSEGLIIFLTSEGEIGLAPSGVMPGDCLWTYDTYSWSSVFNLHAIMRQHKGDVLRLHGRVLLAEVIPWLVDQVVPDDAPAKATSRTVPVVEEVKMAVNVDLAQLQVLTCPLRSQPATV